MSRVMQFASDILSPFRRVDEAFIAHHLNPAEQEALLRLRKAEILHAQAAARAAKELTGHLEPAERRAVIRAALLHDTGKYRHAAGPLEKTFLVLFGKLIYRLLEGHEKPKGLDTYINHGQYSYEVVRRLGSFADFPYLYEVIRYHHGPQGMQGRYGKKEQDILQIIRAADESS